MEETAGAADTALSQAILEAMRSGAGTAEAIVQATRRTGGRFDSQARAHGGAFGGKPTTPDVGENERQTRYPRQSRYHEVSENGNR